MKAGRIPMQRNNIAKRVFSVFNPAKIRQKIPYNDAIKEKRSLVQWVNIFKPLD